MANIYIGCSGFSERLWKGYFYPDNLPTNEYLIYYAQQLNSVEINSTFYRKPTLKTLAKWYSQVPADFSFFIKMPKFITHINRLANSEVLIDDFCKHLAEGLKDKLAGFLFQLPPSFKYSPDNLELVIRAAQPQYMNAVEFRDKSWWTDEVRKRLAEKNIMFSGVSIPKDIPEAFIGNVAARAYYRLHGNPIMFKSEYSREYLENLAKSIINFEGEVYIYFNNTFGIAGIKNALTLRDLLQIRPQLTTLFD